MIPPSFHAMYYFNIGGQMNVWSFYSVFVPLFNSLPIFLNPISKRGKDRRVTKPSTRKTATNPQVSMNQPVRGKITIIDKLNIMEFILSMVARTLEGK